MDFKKNGLMINLLLLILVPVTGFVLFQLLQPSCEPCLEGSPCPPCRSSAQEIIILTAFIVELIFLARLIIELKKR